MFGSIHLKFIHEQWTIQQLVEIYDAKRLDLNPHYQRNAIWSLRTQQCLIDTIQKGYPLPNFFLRRRPAGILEVVDGQQRCRSILGFWNNEFPDSQKTSLTEVVKRSASGAESLDSYLAYKLSVCIIDSVVTDNEVEAFYVLVNSSGMRLNRPELRKAKFYATRFLALSNEIADDELFAGLKLFSDASEDRMNDVDFVSELLTFLKWGFTDKKETVDEVFRTDIDQGEYDKLKTRAIDTLRKIVALDHIVPITKTRFKQRGDFYTLFAFVSLHPECSNELLEYYYRTLLRLSPHISPSQEECDPLLDYATNCVTQSNSKKAREKRHEFFLQMFLNKSETPTATQEAIADFMRLTENPYIQKENLFLVRWELLK